MVELLNQLVELRKHSKKQLEALATLRVYIKYMLFDLEATRRENLYLEKLLNKQENG